MAFGFSDPHGWILLNRANDCFPLLHQSSLEGSSAPSAGAGQALGAGLPHLEHTQVRADGQPQAPPEKHLPSCSPYGRRLKGEQGQGQPRTVLPLSVLLRGP